MKVYHEKNHERFEFEAGFMILDVNGKRFQITEDDDGTLEIWVDYKIHRLIVLPIENNKISVDAMLKREE